VVGLASSLVAGVLLQAAGWRMLNAYLLPWLVAAIVSILWLGRVQRAARRAASASSRLRQDLPE
jgi:hypothetical protein